MRFHISAYMMGCIFMHSKAPRGVLKNEISPFSVYFSATWGVF